MDEFWPSQVSFPSKSGELVLLTVGFTAVSYPNGTRRMKWNLWSWARFLRPQSGPCCIQEATLPREMEMGS